MTATNHYHDRIARATKRLAQLQARELVAGQRRDTRAKEAAKRERARRRHSVAGLVTLAGADGLDDAELLGALLNHLDARIDYPVRQLAADRGKLRMQQEDEERPQRVS